MASSENGTGGLRLIEAQQHGLNRIGKFLAAGRRASIRLTRNLSTAL